MSSFDNSRIKKEEARKRNDIRRETIGKFFLDLAKLTFAAIVLGGLTPMYTDIDKSANWGLIVAGTAFTIVFSLIGNKILK